MGISSRWRWMGALWLVAATQTFAEISEDRVLILVNNASPTSHYAAQRYRYHHPGVPADHVVYLNGLPDIATTADEIITRDNFETYIAGPVRQYLLDHDLVDQIWVIVTTDGMPYRIADTTYITVVYPHGSDAVAVSAHTAEIDAAAVESELAVLWQIDPALDPNHRAPIAARLVNPYHGYVSPMAEFCADRDILGRRQTFRFVAPLFDNSRVYEGQEFSFYRATGGRQFSIKDMYLVSRLAGPRAQGTPPDYYIARMLKLAARVSDPNNANFHGYDPAWSAVIIDDKATGSVSDNNKWYNAGSALSLDTPPEQYLTSAAYPTPPNASNSGYSRDDFRYAYRSLIGSAGLPDPNDGMVVELMGVGRIGGPVLYDPQDVLISTNGLDANYGVIALCSFGIHQPGGVPPTYLLDGGPNGTPLVHPVYGGIFNSSESFNAVTFFADADIPVWAQQGLIWQWFAIEGSGALGHVFEPLSGAVADNDLLFFNYLRDADTNGIGDMTFVEAAYSSIPYLSWATVVVGDPLMRLHRVYGVGPGWMEASPFTCGTGPPLGLVGSVAVLGWGVRMRVVWHRIRRKSL